jgi:beta-phosphoglucomutase-like phosphatase (HAD superfamily)
MVVSAGPAAFATTRSRRLARRPRLRSVPQTTETLEVAARTPRPLELDTISSRWQVALDAAQRAVGAAVGLLPAREVARRAGELLQEREQTAEMLGSLAHIAGVRPAPWLSRVPVTPKMLGLPATTNACLFDLDGVLTDSAILHAWAWAEVLDEFLLRVSEKAGRHFIPFDKDADYRAYIDGRPRLEGVRAFLGSRGIRLPEGSFDDPADADTARGLAKRKGEVLVRRVRERGSAALVGARRYLEAAGHAGLKRAVISASANTLPMLELAGLATLIEQQIDAEVIRTERLRSRPAPDLLLVACRRLGVGAEEAVTFTHSVAGVAAGHTAGLAVIGVGDGARGELLQGFGAERVVPSLSVLLDRRLSEASR